MEEEEDEEVEEEEEEDEVKIQVDIAQAETLCFPIFVINCALIRKHWSLCLKMLRLQKKVVLK